MLKVRWQVLSKVMTRSDVERCGKQLPTLGDNTGLEFDRDDHSRICTADSTSPRVAAMLPRGVGPCPAA